MSGYDAISEAGYYKVDGVRLEPVSCLLNWQHRLSTAQANVFLIPAQWFYCHAIIDDYYPTLISWACWVQQSSDPALEETHLDSSGRSLQPGRRSRHSVDPDQRRQHWLSLCSVEQWWLVPWDEYQETASLIVLINSALPASLDLPQPILHWLFSHALVQTDRQISI